MSTWLRSMFTTKFKRIFRSITFTITRANKRSTIFYMATLPRSRPIVILSHRGRRLRTNYFRNLTPLIHIRLFRIRSFQIFLSTSPFRTNGAIQPRVSRNSGLILRYHRLIKQERSVNNFHSSIHITITYFSLSHILG